jgi:hypothetical protein
MPRWVKFAILVIFLLLIASIPLAMQLESGSIEGLITNEKGPVPGASVEARNVMSGAVWRTTSGAGGYYKLEEVRAGRYSLWVRAENHSAAWLQRIAVERGQRTHADVYLARSTTDVQTTAVRSLSLDTASRE